MIKALTTILVALLALRIVGELLPWPLRGAFSSLFAPMALLFLIVMSFSFIFGGRRGPRSVLEMLSWLIAFAGIFVFLMVVNLVVLIIRLVIHGFALDRTAMLEDLVAFVERTADAVVAANTTRLLSRR